MKSMISKFQQHYGWFGLIRILIYPLTMLLVNPVVLLFSLWNCRSLFKGRLEDYPHFNTTSALTGYFYKARYMNLKLYGRTGISKTTGLGNYPMARYFVYSKVALMFFSYGGVLTFIISMFIWLSSHVLWLSSIPLHWFIVIITLTLISTSFTSNLFHHQNYNVVGWAFFPLAIYGILTGHWYLAALAWFLVTFGSVTALFVGSIISFVYAVNTLSIMPLLILIPAWIKQLTHFYPFLYTKDSKTIFHNMLKALGIERKTPKYKRGLNAYTNILIGEAYFLLLYVQFIFVYYMQNNQLPVLFVTGVILYIINTNIARFADNQTPNILLLTLALAHTLQSPSAVLIVSYWLVASPLPVILGFPGFSNFFNNFQCRKVLDVLPVVRPINISPIMEGLEKLLKPVKKGEKVMVVFDNPKGVYVDVLDGYRCLIEIPLFIAAKREFHLLPDWWGIFQVNYKGAPDFWGRDVESVKKNVGQWNLDYVIVYQTNNSILDPKWTKNGFREMSSFSWKKYKKIFDGQLPYAGADPYWWLLKVDKKILRKLQSHNEYRPFIVLSHQGSEQIKK